MQFAQVTGPGSTTTGTTGMYPHHPAAGNPYSTNPGTHHYAQINQPQHSVLSRGMYSYHSEPMDPKFQHSW